MEISDDIGISNVFGSKKLVVLNLTLEGQIYLYDVISLSCEKRTNFKFNPMAPGIADVWIFE